MFDVISRPGNWRSSGFGLTGLNQPAALSDLSLIAPEIDPRDARVLLRAGEIGRMEGQASLQDDT